MTRRFRIHAVLSCAVAITMSAVFGISTRAQTPLAIDSARITISGTSTIHPYTVATTTVRVTRSSLACAFRGPESWTEVLKPGAVEAFEIAIPVATLASPKDGLNKNMHKALKVQDYPDITFRLLRFEPSATHTAKAVGMLRIAGVERQIAFDLETAPNASSLTIKGEVQLLMTDYGIKPPTAMLGMLKTDPKVTVTFETVVTIPLT